MEERNTLLINQSTIIFPLGSFQEIEDELILKADKIIVDHVDQALHRGALKKLTGEGQLSENNIFEIKGLISKYFEIDFSFEIELEVLSSSNISKIEKRLNDLKK